MQECPRGDFSDVQRFYENAIPSWVRDYRGREDIDPALAIDLSRILRHFASPKGLSRLLGIERTLGLLDRAVFAEFDSSALAPNQIVDSVDCGKIVALEEVVTYGVNVFAHPSLRYRAQKHGFAEATRTFTQNAAERIAQSGSNSVSGINRRAFYGRLAQVWPEFSETLSESLGYIPLETANTNYNNKTVEPEVAALLLNRKRGNH